MAAISERRKRHTAPIFGGILPIGPGRIPLDVIAGTTLAALAIPEVMGYANIAGTPVITGLYTLILPVLFFAILGSSRHLVVGADSASAAILATGLVAMGAVAESTQYVELASLAALMCGVLLLLCRVLRLGFIANFLSRSVLIGFLTGVGIQVAMGQLAGIFGITGISGTTLQKFFDTLKAIPTETNVPTLVLSLAVLAVAVGLPLINKKIPAALIAVLGAILLSYLVPLTDYGITLLGPVPSGLPTLGLPTEVMTAANIASLLPTVIGIVVVILAQSAATASAYALKYGDSFDENLDLVGLSAASIGAGISGTFVVNGSPTKTEMVDGAGGKSQIAQLTAGAIVVIVLLFLTVPLSYMPNCVLSAIVFLIGIKLIDIKGMRGIARVRTGEFAVAAVTATIVVVVGVEQGVISAMFLSILEHLYHSYKPLDVLLATTPEGAVTVSKLSDGTQAAPGLLIYRFGASLYYANASRFSEEVMELVEAADPKLRWLAIEASSIGDIDYSGADALRRMDEELKAHDITLVMFGVDDRVKALLDSYGLAQAIGPDRFFDDPAALLAAYAATGGGAVTDEAPAAAADGGDAPQEPAPAG
jgi:sulfate permease, SulP family